RLLGRRENDHRVHRRLAQQRDDIDPEWDPARIPGLFRDLLERDFQLGLGWIVSDGCVARPHILGLLRAHTVLLAQLNWGGRPRGELRSHRCIPPVPYLPWKPVPSPIWHAVSLC